jgi:hypothetical protein
MVTVYIYMRVENTGKQNQHSIFLTILLRFTVLNFVRRDDIVEAYDLKRVIVKFHLDLLTVMAGMWFKIWFDNCYYNCWVECSLQS